MNQQLTQIPLPPINSPTLMKYLHQPIFIHPSYTDNLTLDVLNLKTEPGAKVALWDLNHGPNQQCILEQLYNGNFVFRALHSQLYICGTYLQNDIIQQIPCPNCEWRVEKWEDADRELFTIQNVINLLNIDIRCQGRTNGTRVWLYGQNGTAAQTFRFEFVNQDLEQKKNALQFEENRKGGNRDLNGEIIGYIIPQSQQNKALGIKGSRIDNGDIVSLLGRENEINMKVQKIQCGKEFKFRFLHSNKYLTSCGRAQPMEQWENASDSLFILEYTNDNDDSFYIYIYIYIM